jgi:putative redox protein
MEGSQIGSKPTGRDLQCLANHVKEAGSISNYQSGINNSQQEGIVITAKAIWTDNERYIGEADSHHALVMDTAKEKTASTPMELVLIALCGCTASDVVGILRKKREPFTHLQVHAQGERSPGYPAVYTEIKLTYRVGGRVSRKAVEDAVRLSKEKYCSVSAMLEKTAKITAEIEFDDV